MYSIEIRLYKQEDIISFYEAVKNSIPEISKWLPWCDENYSIKDSEQWISEIVPEIWKKKKGCEFVIISTNDNQVVGGCCLEQIDLKAKEASIAYWVKTSETRRGIATKASKFLLKYGFEELNLELIKVITSEENNGSKRVGKKLPYEKILSVKKGFQIRENVSDAVVYVISKKSFANENETQDFDDN